MALFLKLTESEHNVCPTSKTTLRLGEVFFDDGTSHMTNMLNRKFFMFINNNTNNHHIDACFKERESLLYEKYIRIFFFFKTLYVTYGGQWCWSIVKSLICTPPLGSHSNEISWEFSVRNTVCVRDKTTLQNA